MRQLIRTKILPFDELSLQSVKDFDFKRYLFEPLLRDSSKALHFIMGPRGVGKTILLRQLRKELKDSIYLSADTLEPDLDLFQLVQTLHQEFGFRVFFIDEIHFNRGYKKSLKSVYDFLDVQIYSTSSTALSLLDSTYDLSRRVKIHKLHLFPFWEYLKFLGLDVEPISFEALWLENLDPRLERLSPYFETYLQGGALPYASQRTDVLETQKNVIETIIERDIPHISGLNTEDIFEIKKSLEFIGHSSVDGINYSSLSQNLGITKYKAKSYVSLLEAAFLVNVAHPIGANVSKEPKVLMYLPNRLVYMPYARALGGLREDFTTTMFRYLDIEYGYLKTTRGKKTPDYILPYQGQKIILEIGGKNKGHEQFKGLEGFDRKIVLKHGANLKPTDINLLNLGLVKKE